MCAYKRYDVSARGTIPSELGTDRVESISWFEAELARLKATSPNIKVSIFITGSDSGASTPLDHEDSILQIKSTENRISEPISEFLDVNSSTVGQRPDLPKIIHETAQNGGSVAVAST